MYEWAFVVKPGVRKAYFVASLLRCLDGVVGVLTLGVVRTRFESRFWVAIVEGQLLTPENAPRR